MVLCFSVPSILAGHLLGTGTVYGARDAAVQKVPVKQPETQHVKTEINVGGGENKEERTDGGEEGRILDEPSPAATSEWKPEKRVEESKATGMAGEEQGPPR